MRWRQRRTKKKEWTTHNWHGPTIEKLFCLHDFSCVAKRRSMFCVLFFLRFCVLCSLSFSVLPHATCSFGCRYYHSIGRQFHLSVRLFLVVQTHKIIEFATDDAFDHMLWPHKWRANKYFINRNKWYVWPWDESAACPSMNHFWCARLTLDPLPFSMPEPHYSAKARDIIAHYSRYRLAVWRVKRARHEIHSPTRRIFVFFFSFLHSLRFSFAVFAAPVQIHWNGIRGTTKWLNKRPSHHQDSMLHRIACTAPAAPATATTTTTFWLMWVKNRKKAVYKHPLTYLARINRRVVLWWFMSRHFFFLHFSFISRGMQPKQRHHNISCSIHIRKHPSRCPLGLVTFENKTKKEVMSRAFSCYRHCRPMPVQYARKCHCFAAKWMPCQTRKKKH